VTTVALVAAKDAAGSIAATVGALRGLRGVDEVWVVDDGSSDETATRAADAGARVVRLERNRGKGGALAAGLEATPHASRYLLADADLGATAAGLGTLLDAASGALVVGALPSAGSRGGFGFVKTVARRGIRRASGVETQAPLSGQRVVDGPALRALTLAPRFGVEVGMTIDLARAGVPVREVPVEVDHHHRGKSLAGFTHRAKQGVDIAGALLTRVTTEWQRIVAVVLAGLASFCALTGVSAAWQPPKGEPLPRASKVILVAYDGLSLSDLERRDVFALPALQTLARRGAVGALSVRTSDRRSLSRRAGSERPSLADAFATLGASARVRAADTMPASRTLARRDHADSLPGALGDALHDAGRTTGVVAGSPASLALADRRGAVDDSASADVVLISALTDAFDTDVQLDNLGDLSDAVVIAFSPTPPGKDWQLTPIVVAGKGIPHGSIESTTTRRPALAGLVDIAPTVLHILGIKPSAAMTGAPLRVSRTSPHLARYERLQVDGAVRSRFFLPASVGYTVVGIVFYLLFMAALRWGAPRRVRAWLRVGVCVAAAFPFALLVTGAVQHWLHFGGESPLFLIAVTGAIGVVASRLKGVGPVYTLAALCVAVIAVDVAATGPLHASSLLGYTIQTSGRYYGLPNASFSIFASSLLLVGAAVAGWVPTRVGASGAATVMFVGTAFLAAPWLGNDVGGFLTLLPVSIAATWALFGGKFTRRTLVVGAVAAVLVFIAVAVLEARAGGSHLSRAATETASNRAGLRNTLTRRVNANFGLLVDQWWGFLSIGLALIGLALLARTRRFAGYLPARSGLRVASIAVLVTSIVGFLANDSGPVVNVLCLVVLAPAIALTALAGPRSASGFVGAP
jgi:glycosyl transferase family 2